MPVYALIALFIAVFGGAHAAMLSLRTYFDEFIKKHAHIASSSISIIKEKCDLSSATTAKASNFASALKKVQFYWSLLLILPSAAFSLFIFGLAVYLSCHWHHIASQQLIDVKSNLYRGLLIGYTGINCIIVGLAVWIAISCRNIATSSEMSAQAVVDANNKAISSINPVNPPSGGNSP